MPLFIPSRQTQPAPGDDPADGLECPRCRRGVADQPQARDGHCAICGLRMVRSVRESEAEAWRRLYGRGQDDPTRPGG